MKLKIEAQEFEIKKTDDGELDLGLCTLSKQDSLELAEFIHAVFGGPEEPVIFTLEEAKKVMKATGCKMRAVNEDGSFAGTAMAYWDSEMGTFMYDSQDSLGIVEPLEGYGQFHIGLRILPE